MEVQEAAQRYDREPSALSDRLLATIGRTYAPRNALRKSLTQLASVLQAEHFYLVVRGGDTYRSLYGKGPELQAGGEERCWKLAALREPGDGEDILLPVPIRGIDRISGERLKGVLLLREVAESERIEAELSRKIGEQTIRSILGEHLSNLLEWHDTDAYRSGLQRLVGAVNQRNQSRDVAYQVAHETRAATRYGGGCVTLSWSEQERALIPLAVLAPLDAPRSRRRDMPQVKWEGEADPGALAALEGKALLASEEEGGGLSLIEIDPTANRPIVSSEVSGDTFEVISHLLRLLDDRSMSPGGAKLVIPIVSHAQCLAVQVLSGKPNGFSERDVVIATRYAAYCIPALVRERQFFIDLEYLDSAAKFRPHLPLSESQPLVMNSLCERIRRQHAADQVVVIPYNYRRKETDGAGIATAGAVDLAGSEATAYPAELVERLLRSEDGSLECHLLPGPDGVERWHCRTKEGEDGLEAFDLEVAPDSLLSRNGTRSFYAKVLRQKKMIPNGSPIEYPIGFLFVDYSRWRGLARSLEKGRPEFAMVEKNWINYYAEVFSRYLATHREVESRFRIDRRIREIYDNLSKEMSETEAWMEALLHDILNAALELVEGTAGVLAVPCNEHRDLKVIAAVGVNKEKARDHIQYGEGVTGYCGEQLLSTVVVDSTDETTWPAGVKPLPWVEGSRSEIAVPVRADTRLIGVLDVESQLAIGAFGEEEVETLKQLGRASALALSLAGRLEQLRSLRKVGEEIDRASDAKAAFDAILSEAMRITGAYAASAREIDPTGTRLEPVLHKGVTGEFAGKPVATVQGVVGWAFREQRTCVIDDFERKLDILEKYGENLAPIASRGDARSELCVPITWDADRIGVLNLEHVHESALADYKDYAEALASQVAFVLAQRRQHRRRLESQDEKLVEGVTQFAGAIAHEVQREFTEIIDKIGTHGRDLGEKWLSDIEETATIGREETTRLIQFASNPLAPEVELNSEDLVNEVIREYAGNESCQMKPLKTIGPPLTVRCKKGWVTWCLRTLVNNSIIHKGRKRKPTIEITLDCSSQDNWLWIVVADDGPGVAPKQLENLFEWDWTSTARQSAGRGLPLLRTFIEEMGGTVIAEPASSRRGLAVKIGLPREAKAQW